MISYSIYIVDDEKAIREGIGEALSSQYQIEAFATAEEAFQAMEKHRPDLVLLDIGLPGMNGIEALKTIKEHHPDVFVIMITAYEDIQTVISSMKLGAHDYVVKPIHMDGLEVTIRNALDSVRLKKEVQTLQERYLKENLPFFIGESNAIQDVMEFIGRAAKSPDTPVLIFGDTGTGKELIASAIHYRSPNFKGPLVTVNCAAIPRDLIESELFGYEKGAFSGAYSGGKRGMIEEAANGTLFLDEVGDLSLEAQAKLLRFLEDGEFYRVGGTKQLQIRTRVVSATNKDLTGMIEGGLFRKDLYFRIAVVQVQVPSLNARRDDIIPLAEYFLVKFNQKFGQNFTGISDSAKHALLDHEWVGNVRELKNLVERAVLIGSGPELTAQDIGLDNGNQTDTYGSDVSYPPLSSEGMDLASKLESVERFYIQEALRMSGGNESKAARMLNMNHHTFRYRRRRLEIP